jgi:serine/threonine protein kinase
MSPEQLGGKNLDARSDIFSLGVLLYEMATGKRPFDGDSPISTITAILDHTPAPASALRDSIPSSLDSIISRCLEKNPQQRFQSAEQLKQALRGVGDDPTSGDSSRSVVRIAIGTVALLAAIIAGIMLWPNRQEEVQLTPNEVPAGTAEQQRGPSIAVLPFTNASGDPEQEYLSNGLTEELITQLSKYQELLVVASTSILEYKDRRAICR